jgi:hypothetical protein
MRSTEDLDRTLKAVGVRDVAALLAALEDKRPATGSLPFAGMTFDRSRLSRFRVLKTLATMAYPWKTRRVRQIGNAVLVPLARALGACALS